MLLWLDEVEDGLALNGDPESPLVRCGMGMGGVKLVVVVVIGITLACLPLQGGGESVLVWAGDFVTLHILALDVLKPFQYHVSIHHVKAHQGGNTQPCQNGPFGLSRNLLCIHSLSSCPWFPAFAIADIHFPPALVADNLVRAVDLLEPGCVTACCIWVELFAELIVPLLDLLL